MKVQTFSVVVGTEACNARCPFCISKQTTGIPKCAKINLNSFRRACRLAQLGGSTTVLLTGKGEPMLYQEEIETYLKELKPDDFPRVEIQTNGIKLWDDYQKNGNLDYLARWNDLGLTTIALSIVDYVPESNRLIYTPYRKDYIDLFKLTEAIHQYGIMVRWSVIMLKNRIDSIDSAQKMLRIAKENKAEQLTFRAVMATNETRDPEINRWTNENKPLHTEEINKWIAENATKLMTLSHGATIYDYEGQNVCITDCMTLKANSDDIRTLIFCSDGLVRYDWRYNGAIV